MKESNQPDAIKRELEEQAPFLAALKRDFPTDGFSVPDQYFQQNKLELIQAIRAEQIAEITQPTRRIDWWRSPKLALAASVVLLIAAGSYFFWPDRLAARDINFDNLTTAEMASYIQQNLDEFEEELLVDYVAPGANRWPILSGEQFSEDELDQLYEELLDEVNLEDLL